MKNLLFLIILAGVITSCQKKQLFSASPEIDIIKKGNEAYVKGDWTTLRSLYADTAHIWVNSWFGPELTPDKFIEIEKAGAADFTDVKLSTDNAIYEMVVTDDGDHWVHYWAGWSGKAAKTGKEAKSAVHIAAQVEHGKVVNFLVVIDSLPAFLASQPDSTQVMK